jgi:hypothetical protein
MIKSPNFKSKSLVQKPIVPIVKNVKNIFIFFVFIFLINFNLLKINSIIVNKL